MAQQTRLRLFDLAMIVIGLVIGMGIFRTSRDAAGAALTPLIYFAAWFFGGIVAMCGALTYAEIGSRFPFTGAYYRIFSYAYHPSLAFALNVSILISNASSIGAVALIGAGYLLPLFINQPSPFEEQLVAIVAILLFYFINLKGLRLSSTTQNLLMIVKIIMLLIIISALFNINVWNPQNVKFNSNASAGITEMLSSFGLALVAVSFTYGGYQQTINFGSEVNNATRNIPKAIVAGIAAIIVLYLLTNFAYYLVIGFNEMKDTREIASVVVSRMFGDVGATIFSFMLFLSVLAYVNVNLLSNPRVMFAMSEDRVLPGIFARVNKKNSVYPFSLTVFAIVSILVVFFAETFERILSFSIFLDCFGMAMSAATLFLLRKRQRNTDAGVYKMKGFPFIPLLFILNYLFVGIIISINSPWIAATGVAVLVVAMLIYFIGRMFTITR